jgi:hypothetical protein
MNTFNTMFASNTNWRLRTPGASYRVDIFVKVQLTNEMIQYFCEVNAIVFRYIGVILFTNPEDITLFRLRFNI